jgi:hypothetical protein
MICRCLAAKYPEQEVIIKRHGSKNKINTHGHEEEAVLQDRCGRQ